MCQVNSVIYNPYLKFMGNLKNNSINIESLVRTDNY